MSTKMEYWEPPILPAMQPPHSRHTCFSMGLGYQPHFRSYTLNSLREDSTTRYTRARSQEHHQAQLRQKQIVDVHMKEKAHAVGDALRVFCHIIPKGGKRKLISAWRLPHKVNDVLQDGQLYVLVTGHKVHFERLKNHVPAQWEWTTPLDTFGLDQNVAIIADPFVEENNEEITSDISRDSFLPEQLPEASFELDSTQPVPPRTIQARTQLAFEQGKSHRNFSHFGYPSDSESGREMIEQPIADLAQQTQFFEFVDLEPLFSDQEEIQPQATTRSLLPSPTGTSAPLLSYPSLTDTLSNFPMFSSELEAQ